MIKKTVIIITIALSFISVKNNSCLADIYMYIDSNGIFHFTDVPTSTDYKIYIKEKRERKKPGTNSDKYDDIIKKAHKKHGVEFYLIKAVICVESGFNPEAVSKKGARGLMQIMPVNDKNLSVKDPFNPSQNIMGGTLYLKNLLKKYKYQLPLALAAYNAGPQAVDRYKRIPPYRETQDYVRKVMEVYTAYKQS